jgi:predicted ferric reductase
MQRPFYELFSKLHCGLAVLATATLWQHLFLSKSISRFYVLGAGGFYIVIRIMHCLTCFLRNTLIGQPSTRAFVEAKNGVIRITIRPRRHLKVRAGQYVYLWMPGVDFKSIFQKHPFMITWWDEDENGKACSIMLLAQPRYGFTSKLLRPQIAREPLLAWVDGPYGRLAESSNFSHALLIASGIGIAAQLPVAREILQQVGKQKTRIKSIHLLWEIESDGMIAILPYASLRAPY